MRRLMEQHGFRVTAMKPMWFDSFYVSMLSEKNLGAGTLGLAKAFWQGARSNLHASGDVSRCSSLIYLIRRTT